MRKVAEERCQRAGSRCCAALQSGAGVSESLYSAPSALPRSGKRQKEEIHPDTGSR